MGKSLTCQKVNLDRKIRNNPSQHGDVHYFSWYHKWSQKKYAKVNLEGIYVMYESKNINDLNNVLLEELDKVMKWFSANKLVINLSKTNTMLFSQ